VGARVEVVPTSARWESYYLPARGIPIARGWFRQTDLERNRVLYGTRLTRAAYEAWLERSAVQFVLLTPFPLDDHGARPESRLLRSGHSGLRIAWVRGGFTIYAVRGEARLMIGGAGVRLTSFGHDGITGTVHRGGVDALRVAYSPYWTVAGSATCVVRSRTGMSAVRFSRAGHFALTMTRDPFTIAHRIADADC
jgi:hypothetical protein